MSSSSSEEDARLTEAVDPAHQKLFGEVRSGIEEGEPTLLFLSVGHRRLAVADNALSGGGGQPQ